MTAAVRRRIAIPAVGVLGIALCAGAYYAHWVFFEHRFATVTPGQIYRSGAMPPEQLAEKVREHGIRAVIDFRTQVGDETERNALAALGVKYFSIPSFQRPTDSDVDAFLELAAQSENRPLLIHCEHGVGRAVLFSALYRIEFENWSNERARASAYWGSGLGSFTPDSKKGRFLLEYRRHLPASDREPTGLGTYNPQPLARKAS